LGDNTLTTRSDGNTIPATDHNEVLQALSIDLVPRNNSNAAEDVAGALGTSLYRWLRAYIGEIYIGDAANNLKITEPGAGILRISIPNNDYIELTQGAISIYTNGNKKFSVDDNGISWTSQDDNTIPALKLQAKEVDTGTATGSVGGSLVVVTSARCSITCVAGKTYIFGATWENLTGASAVVAMAVVGVSQTLLEFTRSTGPTAAMGLTVAYTAAGSGAYDFEIYGQSWGAMTNMRTWAKEA